MKNSTSYVAWIALFLSILSLILTINTSQALRELEQTVVAVEQELSVEVADLEADLERGINRIATEVDPEELEAEIAALRADLAATYENAEAEVQQEWRQVDNELARIEEAAEADAVAALEELQVMIATE